MRTTLLALVAVASLDACVATVGPSRPSGPPPAAPPPAAPPERRQEPRIIEGTVWDAVTRQPISRAAIDITSPAFQGEMTVTTGPDGRYRTGEIPRGEFGIRCRREGYEVVQRKAVMNDGIAHIDFELTPRRR